MGAGPYHAIRIGAPLRKGLDVDSLVRAIHIVAPRDDGAQAVGSVVGLDQHLRSRLSPGHKQRDEEESSD